MTTRTIGFIIMDETEPDVPYEVLKFLGFVLALGIIGVLLYFFAPDIFKQIGEVMGSFVRVLAKN